MFRTLEIIGWIWVLISSVIACVLLLNSLISANSAPQEAAGAAISMAIVVIPYCATKALRGINKK